MSLNELLSFGAGATVALAPQIVDRLQSRPIAPSFSPRTELGLSDRQLYEALKTPDTVLTVAGALGAMYEVEWADQYAADDHARMAHCRKIGAALNDVAKLVFGSAGWMPQTYMLRALAPPLALPRYLDSDGRRVLAESHAEYLAGKRYRTRNLLAFARRVPCWQIGRAHV